MMAANLLDNPNDVGMLSLGLRLLSTPGKFGQALGTAGLGAMGDMEQAKQAQAMAQQRMMQQEVQRMQLKDLRRKQAQAAADQARKAQDDTILQGMFHPLPGPMPNGAAGVQPRFDLQSMIGRGLSMDSVPEALKLQQVLNPPRKLTAYKPGEQVLDEAGNVVFSVPDKAAEDKNVSLLKMIHGEGTPAFFSALRKLGEKMTTHAPAASAVAYGSPVPIQLPDGSVGYAQPGNRPGAPPQLMNDPTSGRPLTKPPGAEAAPTEDERKAAGWVSQAETAWTNMRAAAFDANGKLKPDAKPGAVEMMVPNEAVRNLSRSPGRQKFVQASSSLSESLLRAATGAGVNKDEAEQKVRELTPQSFDSPEVIKQKMDAIPPYLQSLRTRANRALPKNLPPVSPVPGAGQPKAKFLGFE